MPTIRRWWWIPLVIVVGIFVKAVLLTPWVAEQAEDAALTALGTAGLDAVSFVGVDGVDGFGGDGLNVTIEGPAADETRAVEVVAARDEVNRVTYRVADGRSDDGAGDATTSSSASSIKTAVGLQMEIRRTGSVVLTGAVPDGGTRDAIVAQARAAFGSGMVTDEVTVDESTTAAGGSLTVSGEAASEIEQRAWVDGAEAIAASAGIGVVDQTTVAALDEQLNDLFQLEPIEFDVNESTITDSSRATLDRAAAALNASPRAGRLLVVGHTDSDGPASFNLRLSEARAQAVVDYLVETGGVDAARLQAEGRGAEQLLVDPEVSAEDRQRNRRIEWELLP